MRCVLNSRIGSCMLSAFYFFFLLSPFWFKLSAKYYLLSAHTTIPPPPPLYSPLQPWPIASWCGRNYMACSLYCHTLNLLWTGTGNTHTRTHTHAHTRTHTHTDTSIPPRRTDLC
jgi:hypothetical protein